MCKEKGIVTLSLVTCSGRWCSGSRRKVLRLRWSDYIAEDTIANFEKESIKVVYDVFDNEVLEAKLLAGTPVLMWSLPVQFLARRDQAGVFMPLDKSKLPNLANIDADVMKLLQDKDPDSTHSLSGCYHRDRFQSEEVAEVMGPDFQDG